MTARRAIALAAALLTAPVCASAARRPVRTMLELRQDGVVRQAWDLSCGAAALSTVLTYDLGDAVPERTIVDALLRGADADRIRRRGGFSLLDLKRFAVGRGYQASGFGNLDLTALERLGTAIVPTLDDAGPHFMVFRGVVRGRVVLADPAYGRRTMARDDFVEIWSPRVAFVVRRGARPGGPPAGATALAPPRVAPPILRGAVGGAP
jgi:predicted double-glycine peptidase